MTKHHLPNYLRTHRSLAPGQTEQFSAAVSGSSNTAVTWTIDPATAGSIGSTGFYTAPATSPSSPQLVTIQAVSAADPTQSATATVALIATPGVNNYSHRRPIVIDHTKVPNTDRPIPCFTSRTAAAQSPRARRTRPASGTAITRWCCTLANRPAPYPDSTANAFASTGGVSPAQTPGKIGSGQSFDGATQYIAWAQSQSPNPNTAISLETWIETTDTPASGSPAEGIFGKWDSDGGSAADQSFELVYRANGHPGGLLEQDNLAAAESDAPTAIDDGNRRHLAVTAPANYMRGFLDEIRISNSVRSADWIATQYASQNSPSTFYIIYPENSNSLAPATATIASSPLGPQSRQFSATFTAGTVVSSQSNPLVLPGTAPTASNAGSIAINGHYAYLCDNNEITIFDVTNPASPVLLTSITSNYIQNDGFTHCAIQQGALVEFADEAASRLGDSPGFLAFSLQNPAQPQPEAESASTATWAVAC